MNKSFLNSKQSRLLMLGITLVATLGKDFLLPNNAENLLGISHEVEAQVIDNSNRETQSFIDRAKEKFKKGNYQEALANCTQAIRLSPKYAPAY
ncbi:MAG: hypothetical protein ACK45T_26080, partial [Pseudanabaena sp.]